MTLRMQKPPPSFPFHCLGRGRSLGGSSGGTRPSDPPQTSPVAGEDQSLSHLRAKLQLVQGNRCWTQKETRAGTLILTSLVTSPLCFPPCVSPSLEVTALAHHVAADLSVSPPGTALDRWAAHHGCHAASLSPLRVQLCTLARAAHMSMTQGTGCLGCPSSSSPLLSLREKPGS